MSIKNFWPSRSTKIFYVYHIYYNIHYSSCYISFVYLNTISIIFSNCKYIHYYNYLFIHMWLCYNKNEMLHFEVSCCGRVPNKELKILHKGVHTSMKELMFQKGKTEI